MNSCIYISPFGSLCLTENKGFLVKVSFVGKKLKSDISIEQFEVNVTNVLKKTCDQLENYFSGNSKNFSLPISILGTPFQLSAWKSLLYIPYGETRSYFQQAKSINKPKAVRAIGNANSKNPIPIIIPCHRVIGKDGSLTGYLGGEAWKANLIELEKSFKSEQKN